MSFTIDEVAIPTALDGSPEALAFEGSVDARNAAEVASFGTTDMIYTAAELLPGWQPSEHGARRLLVARLDGRIVARGVMRPGSRATRRPRGGCKCRCTPSSPAAASGARSPTNSSG
jgi:hypothetical protein